MSEEDRRAAQAKFVKGLLDDIWNMGHCPKIVIDATHKDVVIPEHVRTAWGERLAIDLEATYPMEPSFDEDAFRLTLAFQGNVVRCVFPWSRIYMVGDRETGRAALIAENAPESTKAALAQTERPAPALQPIVQTPEFNAKPTKKPNPFRVIPGGKKN